ncbi:Metabotropic glutamate receptor 2 [Zootermopsis nevadensis]|uniref:Metabotropic glutamate receptor 2 n=1 Tax=Zootermopsis nevadensis TaxID=136037 RepID=A0A067QY07_ZOONE|nr:Metabotropic glutamate receptor 2 [Zootermopsis nevadensis]
MCVNIRERSKLLTTSRRMTCVTLQRSYWIRIFMVCFVVTMLFRAGDVTSKRHEASRNYNFYHYHHHHHHYHNHFHHFNRRVHNEYKNEMNTGPSISSSKRTYPPGVQNIPSSQNIDRNSQVDFENSDVSGKFRKVFHGHDGELDAKSRHFFDVREEQSELNTIESSRHVDYSSESIVPSDVAAQRHSDINHALSLQYSLKNKILCHEKCSDETPNHIEHQHQRTSAKQKRKQFFPEITKGISINSLAIGMPVSDRRDTSSVSPEYSSRNRTHFLQDDISKDLSHTSYQNNGHIQSVHRNTSAYTHHKLNKSINLKTLNVVDPRKDVRLLKDQRSRNHRDRNSSQHRHSRHFELVEGRPFRSLVEPVLSSESEDIPWPVKREAVVEGDLILGGLMMVHEREESYTCGPIMPQGGIQALETMLYTLDVLNRDPQMIPNVTIGAHILDDCDKDTYGLEMAVDFIKGKGRLIKAFNFNPFMYYV